MAAADFAAAPSRTALLPLFVPNPALRSKITDLHSQLATLTWTQEHRNTAAKLGLQDLFQAMLAAQSSSACDGAEASGSNAHHSQFQSPCVSPFSPPGLMELLGARIAGSLRESKEWINGSGWEVRLSSHVEAHHGSPLATHLCAALSS